MTTIAVVDHGAGNLVSIGQGLVAAGARPVAVTAPDGLEDVDGVVLPGVGATSAAMGRLADAGLVAALTEYRGPLLGICVGMQLFFEVSEEDGASCLGLIPGTVSRLRDAPRLPHIGWNDISIRRPDPIFAGVPDHTPFYFVHSFAPAPVDPDLVIAEADHGTTFTAAVRSTNLVGVQFHPERSGPAGLAVLANFVALCAGEEADHAA